VNDSVAADNVGGFRCRRLITIPWQIRTPHRPPVIFLSLKLLCDVRSIYSPVSVRPRRFATLRRTAISTPIYQIECFPLAPRERAGPRPLPQLHGWPVGSIEEDVNAER
jgi:hypothetical protein